MVRDAVAEVRERTDIVELISTTVPLTRAGRSYKGLCPFHQEKTPSFVVFPETQGFHCFGCGKGGDVFTYYMLHEKTEFKEALEELARRTGVQLSTVPTIAPEVDAHRRRLIEINELAATFYANILSNAKEGEPGRRVIAERGVSPEMVSRFRLGYAIDAWDTLLRFLNSRNIDPEVAAEAGLLSPRDSGGHYDRFRGRLMFPIRNRDGEVVGFGARIVGEGQPKYLNSPQSPIFDKSALVYGLDLAKDEVRKREQVVIVEGYMDAIAAHQFGHANVVAAMGTAFTEAQVAQVKRLSKHIVLALDADAAGQMATLRSLETMRGALDGDEVPVPDPTGLVRFERKLNAEISIVQLPEGKDPDELIRRAPERWPEVVAGAKPFLDFFVNAVTASVRQDDPRAKADAIARLAPVLQQIADRVVLSHYVALVAGTLRLDERVVRSEIRRGTVRTAAAAPARPLRPERTSAEDHLLAVLLNHRSLVRDVLERVPEEDLTDSRNRELLRFLLSPDVPDVSADQIVAGLDDTLADHAERLLATLAGRPEQFPGQVHREATQALDKLSRDRFDFLRQQLQAGIQAAQQAQDLEQVAFYRGQIASLVERHRRFDPPPSPYFRDTRTSKVPV